MQLRDVMSIRRFLDPRDTVSRVEPAWPRLMLPVAQHCGLNIVSLARELALVRGFELRRGRCLLLRRALAPGLSRRREASCVRMYP